MPDENCGFIPNSASANLAAELSFETSHRTWLTAAEAARYLKIKTRTILFWARSGKIKAYRLTGTKRCIWRFAQCDLDAILIHSTPVISSPQPSVLENERSI
jgi:excisionase family DNA binding protein